MRETFDENDEKLFNDEVRQLSRISHPNIIKLIGISSSPKALIMEYADGGSLYNRNAIHFFLIIIYFSKFSTSFHFNSIYSFRCYQLDASMCSWRFLPA